MTPQTGKQTTAIHTQPNISRSIDHRTMKFGQLIENNMKNIFMKNNAQNLVEKLIPGPFLKNQNSAYLWINNLKFYRVCFYWGLPAYIKSKMLTLVFTSYEAFSTIKKRSETSLSGSFSAWFLKKNIHYILLTNQISLSDCLIFLKYLAIYWL